MVNMTCTRIETTCPNGAALVYRNMRGNERIDLSFAVGSEIFYQPINWESRIERPMYYATLKRFYRELRRSGVTQRSLHHLAGGTKRSRNAGWAPGTSGYHDFQSWLSKARSSIALSLQHLSDPIAVPSAQQRESELID